MHHSSEASQLLPLIGRFEDAQIMLVDVRDPGNSREHTETYVKLQRLPTTPSDRGAVVPFRDTKSAWLEF